MKMKQSGFPLRIALGGLIGTAAAFALCMLGGVLLAKGTLPEQMAPLAAIIAAAGGGAVGALVAGRGAYRLIGSLSGALLMLALLLALHAAVFAKAPYMLGIPCAAILAFAAAIGLIRIKTPRHRVKYR